MVDPENFAVCNSEFMNHIPELKFQQARSHANVIKNKKKYLGILEIEWNSLCSHAPLSGPSIGHSDLRKLTMQNLKSRSAFV